MALHVGQKRNIDYSSFSSQITSSTNASTSIQSKNIFGTTSNWEYSELYFQDCGFRKAEGTFSSSEMYYLTLKLQRQQSEINFDIRLQIGNYNNSAENPCQILKKCTLHAKIDESEIGRYDYYDLVFTPNRNDYNTLVLCISRDASDILISPKAIPNFSSESYHLYSLTNLVNTSNEKYWKKVGIQSRPGSLIVINKQPIRIGRSGIYELNNGTKITNLMIASGWEYNEAGQVINTDVDPFLIDYVYQTNESGG